jgi:hypothetical protein
MGYQTDFNLRMTGNPKLFEIARKDAKYLRRKELNGCSFWEVNELLQNELHVNENMKWYDWERDMRMFSKRHPKILFILKGFGDEPGDVWIAYIQNGKAQVEDECIEYPKLDKKKLI